MPVAPPIPRIPSLNALRAFEASARLGGFALAAEELNVTPGAVAAQVKSLEQEIGAALFVRSAHGVELTKIGQRSLPAFVEAFDSLSQAVRGLRQDAAPRMVHIAALPALAQLWLAPRLPGLRARMPDLDVSVTALETPPNLKRVPFDLCLFYSDVVPQGGVQLQKDELLPVCSPECAHHLKRPADLNKVACLTDTAWVDDWAIWAAQACPGIGLVPRGPVFSLYSLAVEEAISGAGVLMGHTSLVEQHLRSGALVAPFAKNVPLPRAITMWRLPEGRSSEVVTELQRLSGNVD